MKKVFYLLFLSLILVGCGTSVDNSNVSMDSIIEAFESEGVEVDPDEKPMFSLIGAKDGIIFYNDGNVVKVYEFESKKAMGALEDSLPEAKNWDRNGLYLLETSHEESKKIFNGVK